MSSHHIACADCLKSIRFSSLYRPPKVTVRDDTDQDLIGVNNINGSQRETGKISNNIEPRGVGPDVRTVVHEIADRDRQTFAKPASWMVRGKIVYRQAFLFHYGHRKCVANGQSNRCRSSWRQIERACFPIDGSVKNGVRALRDSGLEVADDGDQRNRAFLKSR